MRIGFKVEGGIAFFPGLGRPLVLDTKELPGGEGAELERRVGEARFFEQLPEVGGARPGAADHRRYEVTVEEGGRSHTVRLTDPVKDPGLRALVGALEARTKALRRATRAGSGKGDVGE